jgi:hypothetical protein
MHRSTGSMMTIFALVPSISLANVICPPFVSRKKFFNLEGVEKIRRREMFRTWKDTRK